MRFLVAMLFFLASPALVFGGQADLYLRAQEAEDISSEEWFAMVAGKTVTYRIDDQLWAHETYDPNTNRVYIALADGECMQGIWTHIDGAFCFAWEDNDFVCFRHARSGEDILIIPMQGGDMAGAIQTVASIDDTGLPCGPELIG